MQSPWQDPEQVVLQSQTWSCDPQDLHSVIALFNSIFFINRLLQEKSFGAPSLVHPFLSAVHVVSNDTT